MSLEPLCTWTSPLQSPILDTAGAPIVCCQDTGHVYIVSSSSNNNGGGANTQGLTAIASLDVHPSGVAIDPRDGRMYICDQVSQRILKLEDNNTAYTTFAEQFEGRPLKGPNRIVFSSKNSGVFFTDSGVLGDTTLAEPTGSVFTIVNDILIPIALNCLAHPSGLAVNADGTVLYVCETLQNRVLRFIRRGAGGWLGSVFHTFQGGLGPVDVLVHPTTGQLFVARMELREVGVEGSISILHPTGEEASCLGVPGGEISGIALDAKNGMLYITEASKKVLYRYHLQQ
eukprot:PhF_6_TR9506/c0_g1_i1/m.14817